MEDENGRPKPKHRIIEQGVHPRPGPPPQMDDEKTPTTEQRYRWRRKSLWEASEDEDMTEGAEITCKRARARNTRGTQSQETRGGTGEQQANPYLDVPGDAVWDEAMQPQKGEKTSDTQVDMSGDGKKPKERQVTLNINRPSLNRRTSREEVEPAKGQGEREEEQEEEHDSTEGIGKVNRTKRK